MRRATVAQPPVRRCWRTRWPPTGPRSAPVSPPPMRWAAWPTAVSARWSVMSISGSLWKIHDGYRTGSRPYGGPGRTSRGSALHERLSVFWATPSALQGRARGGRFPRWTGWICSSTGACSPGGTSGTGWPGPGRPNCWWPAPSSRSATWAGPPRCRCVPWPGPGRFPGTMARWPTSVTRRGWPPAAPADHEGRAVPGPFPVHRPDRPVGTNAAAAERYLASPGVPGTGLVRAALAWRHEPPAASAAAVLLNRDLLALYRHYLDDHIVRLDAAASTGWRPVPSLARPPCRAARIGDR